MILNDPPTTMPSQPITTPRSESLARIALPSATIGALLFALAGAASRPAWFDELFTLRLARLSFRGILAALENDSGPPLHYFLVHSIWLAIRWAEGSHQEILFARLPSVLAFTCLPLLLARFGSANRRFFPWGSLIAVSWLPMLYFGTEARSYAILALVNAVLWTLGPRWIERGRRGTVGFALVAATLPLTHNTGVLYLGALFLLPVFLPAPLRVRSLSATAAAGLPFLFFLPMMLHQPVASVEWMNFPGADGRAGLATVEVLSAGGPFPSLFELSKSPIPPALSVTALAAVFAALLAGLIRLAKDRSDVGRRDFALAIRLLAGTSPAFAMAVASGFGAPVYFAGRTEMAAWPLFAAAVGVAATTLDAQTRTLLLAPFVVAGLATETVWLSHLPERLPSTGIQAAEHIAPSLQPGDRIVAAGLWELELRYGLARVDSANPGRPFPRPEFQTFPASLASHPGWLDFEKASSPAHLEEARTLRHQCEALGCRRIWLVWSPSLALSESFFPAFSGWKQFKVFRNQVIAVDLLVNPVPGSPVEERR